MNGETELLKREHRRVRSGALRRLFLFFCALFAGLTIDVTVMSPPKEAYAQLCVKCRCLRNNHRASQRVIRTQHSITQNYIAQQFRLHRQWWVNYYFGVYILPSMMQMTEQLSAVAMQQMMILGAFFDAKIQLETQTILQDMEARAHKDYHPDVELCMIGTNTRSLAASEQRGRVNADILAQRLLARQLLNRNSIASSGVASDKASRFNQFKTTFCNPHDNNNTLDQLCGAGGAIDRQNNDINYGKTLLSPLTIDVALDNTALSTDEEDIMALAANLYANDVFEYLSPKTLAEPGNHDKYLDVRAVTAKRSVAQNSFNALVAMKSNGGVNTSANPYQYMASAMRELGITDNGEITEIIGEYPSYYAQMELLTKKLYQRPEFYTNLYNKPANTKRKAAAIRALGLMQKMDSFESSLRSEAILAVLLEMKIQEAQEEAQNRINELRPQN